MERKKNDRKLSGIIRKEWNALTSDPLLEKLSISNCPINVRLMSNIYGGFLCLISHLKIEYKRGVCNQKKVLGYQISSRCYLTIILVLSIITLSNLIVYVIKVHTCLCHYISYIIHMNPVKEDSNVKKNIHHNYEENR